MKDEIRNRRRLLERIHPGTKRQGCLLEHSTNFGFTLLEVMVALSIIAIVLVAVIRLHHQSIMMMRESDFLVAAPLLANAKLAEIETTFPEVREVSDGNFGEAYPEYSWQLAIGDVEIADLEQVSDDLKQIDLTVSFNRGERDFRLRTFRFIR